MKKTIATLLLSGVVLGGFATGANVLASVTEDPNTGNTTVIGESGSSIELKGQLGEFDPETTDPTAPTALLQEMILGLK